ncbi:MULTISPECIES: hypothetical protein [unclassified Acinetobacter]|uniref:hypothetical protein n=1 Tax=unclassified Acinetobacter TaxID=196816 RepID=UPI0029349BC8|nr:MULTISPECIES: hypothetical protein [unclassified Acinetobacter]WOE33269.1 hypothetical protein QSG84_16035 [Acinetobacter sp. SAAs470]WOE36950.1 hypothetical protein QSG86_00850 [Acinetobacter sp. SAAs474]
MSTFSFVIIKEKSNLLEKDRYRKYNFIKIDYGFYIYARQHMIINKDGKLNSSFFDFIILISEEIQSDVILLINILKNNESEDDIKIKNYMNKKTIDLKRNTIIKHQTLYSYRRIKHG